MKDFLTTLRQSEKLKQIGMPQKSVFYYQGSLHEFSIEKGYYLAFGKELSYEGVVNLSAFTLQELIGILGELFFELCDCRDFAPKHGKYLAVGGAGDNTWEAYGNTIMEAVYNLILLLFAKGELTFNQTQNA